MLFLLGMFGLLLHGPLLLATLRESPLASLDTFFKVEPLSAHGNLRQGLVEQEPLTLSENDAAERRLNTVISPTGVDMQPQGQGDLDNLSEEDKAFINAVFGIVYIVVQSIVLVEALAQIVFLLIYSSAVTQKRPPASAIEPAQGCENETDFPVPMFGCFEDMHYCLHGCFCRPFRIADTYHAAGLRSFWECITFWLIVAYVVPMVFAQAMIVVYPFIVGVLAWHRAQLRGKLGRSSEVNMLDFFLWCCCTCCVAIQEARAIDFASQTRVECCCKLQTDVDDRMPLVGAAVDARTLQVANPANHHVVQPGQGHMNNVNMAQAPLVADAYYQEQLLQQQQQAAVAHQPPVVPGAMAVSQQGHPVVMAAAPMVPGGGRMPMQTPSAPPAGDADMKPSEGAPRVVQGVVIAVNSGEQAASEGDKQETSEPVEAGKAAGAAPAATAPDSSESQSSAAVGGADAQQEDVDSAEQEVPLPAKAGTGEVEPESQPPLVPEPEELRAGDTQDDGARSS